MFFTLLWCGCLFCMLVLANKCICLWNNCMWIGSFLGVSQYIDSSSFWMNWITLARCNIVITGLRILDIWKPDENRWPAEGKDPEQCLHQNWRQFGELCHLLTPGKFLQRGTLHRPQAQKHLGKTQLYPTGTKGFINETLIPTKPSFYFPTKNKSSSTAVSPVDPSHWVLSIRVWLSWLLVHVQMAWGLLSHVALSWPSRAWQWWGVRLAPLWRAWMKDSWGRPGVGVPQCLAASASTLAAKSLEQQWVLGL